MTSALVAELREIIEAERDRFGIPGCAVAVVADGEPVLCEGFGLRDLGRSLPVTTRTLFPIASATKTFTAALCALAAADGALDLHRPARDYLPEFQLADPVASAQASVYDMLCHRVGLPRHDLLWYTACSSGSGSGGSGGRAELVAALRHLSLNRPFRAAWQYNNMLYVVAGYLAGRVLGQSFEEAVADRLFGPLGMKRSNLSSAATLADDDAARPYVYTGPAEPPREIALAPLDLIAPAGGINSCAEDLLPWVLALLGRGFLSPGVLAELCTVRVGLPSHTFLTLDHPVGYGLGLIAEDYRGHRVLHHGGDIDGFTSQVSFVAEAGCAVVFLANRAGTGMRDALPWLVYDRLLGLGSTPHGAAWLAKEEALRTALSSSSSSLSSGAALPLGPVRPVADYVGHYSHPAYGSLTVSSGSSLFLEYRVVAGPLVHRHLEVFDLTVELGGAPEHFAVQFFHDLDGEVSGVSVVLEKAAPPVRFDRVPAALSAAELSGLAGTYRLGPLLAVVSRGGPGGLRVMLVQGDDLPLRHLGGLAFRLGNDRVEFTGDGRLITPLGEFTRS